MKKFNLLNTSYLTFFLLFVANFMFAQTAWQWQNPLPQGTDLLCMKFVDENIGYAVGYAGTILKTTDGGDNWIIQNSGTDVDLRTVFFIDENIGYAGGYGTYYYTNNKVMLKTTDGGLNWTDISCPIKPRSCFFTDENIGFVVGLDGLIMKTTNGGTSWGNLTSGTTENLSDIHFYNNNIGYAVGSYCVILKTIDAGNTWTDVSFGGNSFHCYGVEFISPDTGYVVGNSFNGSILKTINGGVDWTILDPGTVQIYYDVDFINSEIGYVVGGGKIRRTNNGGDTWIEQGNYDSRSVFIHNTENVHIAGLNGKIINSIDGGQNWIYQINTVTDSDLYSVNFTNNNIGYSVGKDGAIIKSIDGGNNWTNQNSGINNDLFSVHFITAEIGYSVGSTGAIIKTTDGGEEWTTLNSTTNNDLHSVYFVNSNIGYSVGSEGTILKTSNSGNNWTSQNFGCSVHLVSVFFTSEQTGYAVGSNCPWTCYSEILRTTDGGNNWVVTDSISDDILNSIFFPDQNTGYIGGNDGLILKTTDGGENWNTMVSFTDFDIKSVYFNDENNGFFIASEQYGKYYFNRILITTDGCETLNGWNFQSTGTSQGLNSIYFPSPDTGYIVGNNGTILYTTSGGIPVYITDSEYRTDSYKIFPNPSSNKLTIEVINNDDKHLNFKVFNLTGQQYLHKQLSESKTELDISSLKPGMYVITIQSRNELTTMKFIKQ